jgi:hypothetical protein
MFNIAYSILYYNKDKNVKNFLNHKYLRIFNVIHIMSLILRLLKVTIREERRKGMQLLTS